ncbi:hypothetical protein DMC25_19330 [Caulobacter sp. D4A]|uniref:hypothetical protein n=1 Tax=unclassified Caulobacter TaxID=2648921 RepID=UPI000D730654|nr:MULTISPECIES: hypothetical protein [unclassified Caulobacter]PXA82748.1 hypothetical protein DMC25_19330 [Caulobacter sp. D4A]PXA91518.1 hypothetical protein DMC18_13025 [Caulobacter sp. D5]
MIRLAVLALPLLLAAPAVAQTLAPQKLVLSRADRDGDGAVSQIEAAEHLALVDERELPTTEPTNWYRQPKMRELGSGSIDDGLMMKRRFVPASGFELENERQFEEALRRRKKR